MNAPGHKLEERITEVQHRLVMTARCVESGGSASFLETEEELFDELRDLERKLAARRAGGHDHRSTSDWR